MVHSCIINGCPSVSGKNLGVFYYRLPKDEMLRNRWMNMITPKPGLILNDNSLICSRHFKEMDYVNYAKHILRKNAVPTMVPLLDHEQADMTVDEIKSEQSSTDCESDVEMLADKQVETIKVEETETPNYNEDSTIRVVDVESILKNQVETSSSSSIENSKRQHVNLNQMKEHSLRDAFKNFTGTTSMVKQGNAPGTVPNVINNNNSNLSNFIYVSQQQQQQQQSPGSLLIELLPLSFPQTSQSKAPLAIQPTQPSGMIVRPVYVQDKKLNQQRLVGTQIVNPEMFHGGVQNIPKIVMPHNTQHMVLPQNAQHMVLPQNAQHMVLPQNAQHMVLPQNTQHMVLPQNAQQMVLPQNTQHMVLPQNTQQMVLPQNVQPIVTMKSEVLDITEDTQTVVPTTKIIRSRHNITNGGPKSLKRKQPQKLIRNVPVSKKITKAKVVVPINKNESATTKLKANYEKLQRKYDEVRAILDLLQEKKLNVEHIKDFLTTKQKCTDNDNSVSCGVWWRGSGFVGTRPN